MSQNKRLCFILGDQLSLSLDSLQAFNKANDVILMCEVMQECTYVHHHPKKIILILSAMRHFAKKLEADGYQVDYVTLDNINNTQNFSDELKRAIKRHNPASIHITHPSEYRVLQAFRALNLDIPLTIYEDNRFFCSIEAFKSYAQGRNQLRMELFYREMRKKHCILMDNHEPVGGLWNYDKENRAFPKEKLNIPERYSKAPDAITQEVIKLVKNHFNQHFGDIEGFDLAVTEHDAQNALLLFIKERLPLFGDYQDAMLIDEPWMYHAHIAFYLNIGLLLPKTCIDKAVEAYQHGHAPLNAVEGFVRQILGWREYVRGIYWLKMPEYKALNYFNAHRPLPKAFWTGNTRMNCLKQCISDTKKNAYAHHIQRLMVLGNFTLLTGISPDDVNEWYLIVYADAFEWVELPNVSGMILFADGGYLGSKPYAAGGAYINKMSDYCKSCHYSVKEKSGDKACPFNYLYWDFLIRHHNKLSKNQRLAMIYKTLERFDEQRINEIKQDAKRFFEKMDASDSH